MNQPLVIFLNGTSSAGKTSIAKAIQKLSPLPMLHVGFDHFYFMLPPTHVMDGENANKGFQLIKDDRGVSIQIGPMGESLTYVMRRSMKMLLDQQFHLIIDEVLISDEWFEDYLELFKETRVFFVGVKPPIEVAEQRELKRGDRFIGLARGLNEIVHRGKNYDLIIDSSQMSPEQSAQIILNHIKVDALNNHLDFANTSQ